MARSNQAEAADTNSNETPATEESTSDQRFIMLTVPEGHAVTSLSEGALPAGEQKRTDVIRALAKTGEYTRGEIAKMVSELQGKKVPYQIVFQATKGIPNVKKAQRGESAESEGETAGEETAAA